MQRESAAHGGPRGASPRTTAPLAMAGSVHGPRNGLPPSPHPVRAAQHHAHLAGVRPGCLVLVQQEIAPGAEDDLVLHVGHVHHKAHGVAKVVLQHAAHDVKCEVVPGVAQVRRVVDRGPAGVPGDQAGAGAAPGHEGHLGVNQGVVQAQDRIAGASGALWRRPHTGVRHVGPPRPAGLAAAGASAGRCRWQRGRGASRPLGGAPTPRQNSTNPLNKICNHWFLPPYQFSI